MNKKLSRNCGFPLLFPGNFAGATRHRSDIRCNKNFTAGPLDRYRFSPAETDQE
jgi:hypothetical protein